MATDWNPSSVHPALSAKFLTPIADLIWKVQRKVSKHVQPQEGDDNWVAGCTAYKRRVHALTQMSLEEGYRDWLWAGHLDTQFGIRIHGFPIRIYRSLEEGGIPERYALGSPGELNLLADLNLKYDAIYRLEVVTKKLGRPLDIRIVEVNEGTGDITNSAAIPRSRDVDAPVAKADLSVRSIRRKPAVVLPKPTVKPNEEKRANPNEKEKPA